MNTPKILLACPTHSTKAYAMERWLGRVRELTYTNIDILLADNSGDDSLYNTWKPRVPIVHLDGLEDEQDPMRRVNLSMSYLRRHFLEHDYDYWFSLEIDIIPPADILELLLRYGQDSDWTSHAYQARGLNYLVQGVGCSLFSRRLMEDFDFADAGNYTPDGWLWLQVKDKMYRTMELWGYCEIDHIAM